MIYWKYKICHLRQQRDNAVIQSFPFAAKFMFEFMVASLKIPVFKHNQNDSLKLYRNHIVSKEGWLAKKRRRSTNQRSRGFKLSKLTFVYKNKN
jgi:hypothetical protein